ncbi:MAG TPA: HAD-IA family hydrolase [Ignavibacteriales bacterium]|nr:HAD-IA family hydrolase [Ignavibacteriales bacterium]
MLKAVIFDLDNTLVDFMRMKRRAIEAAVPAMVDAGLKMSIDEARHEIDVIYKEQGIENQQVFDLFLQKTLKKIDHKILASGIVAYRRAREAALIPYPHVYSTLIQLSKMGLKLGIVSDAPVKEAWLRLAYMNFHHIFDAVVTFDDTGERKPNAAPFRAILDKFSIQPGEALMVGDWAERDILGAKKVGMLTAFAKYGDTFDTKEHDADYELADIMDLLSIVRVLNDLK